MSATPTDAFPQTYVREGDFVAMPLAFPDVSEPLEDDSAFITAIHAAGRLPQVYGATAGRRAHAFLAAPKPPSGVVMYFPLPETVRHVVALRYGAQPAHRVYALAATEAGACLCAFPAMGGGDGIQEWGYLQPDVPVLAEWPGETPLALARIGESTLLVLTDRHLRRFPMDDGKEAGLAGSFDAPLLPGLHVAPDGSACVLGQSGSLFVLRDGDERVSSEKLSVPFGGSGVLMRGMGACIVAGDDAGNLFRLDLTASAAAPLGQAPLAPIHCLALHPDGRVFGFCGDGIGRLFVIDPGEAPRDLGVVTAVHGAKRYAFHLGCASVGPGGEIYFGENDRGGHLWIYHPAWGGAPRFHQSSPKSPNWLE